MKKITFFSLALIFALIKNGYSEAIIATESFVRDGLSTRVTNTKLTNIIKAALSTKADLLVGAVEGNVATVNATGQYIDSGTALSSLAVTKDVTTSLATKANLQAAAKVGNVATINASGQYVDSGTALSALATTANVNTALNTKLSLSGGTMTGAINMGTKKVTSLATPTNSADATTKAYVDAYHTPSSWATLAAQNWAVPGGGPSWQVNNGQNTVYGVAACLSTSTKSGTVPSSNTTGSYCWCQISNINGIEALGAWVYNTDFSDTAKCFTDCTFKCSDCIKDGSSSYCYKSAMLTGI